MNKRKKQPKTILGLSKKGLYKTISYRIISTISNFLLAYLWFNDGIKSVGGFTLVGAFIATVIYYYHEMFYRIVRKKKWMNI